MENRKYLVKLVNYEIGDRGEFHEKDCAEVTINSNSKEKAIEKMEQLMLTDPSFKYLYEGGFIIKSVDNDDEEDLYHV